MKVAHIGEDCKGGVHTYLQNVIEHQIAEDKISEILVMVSENSIPFNFNSTKVKIVTYPYSRSLSKMIKSTIEIHKELKKFGADIVHAHSTFAGMFVRTPLFFVKPQYRVIYCAHGWAFSMQGSKIKKRIYALAERMLSFNTTSIVNISSYDHKEANKYKINKKKCILINNGVKDTFVKNSFGVMDSSPKKIKLLFVGRFDKQKGVDILLDLFSRENFPSIDLYLIGYSVRQDVEFNIPKNVHILGEVSNHKIDQYYINSDAVIIPSRWEGFGLVAVEAMKNNKAIIVSDRGALPNFVINDNGYIFDLNKLETLSKILQSISKETLAEMGKKGREVYETLYTADVMNQKIMNMYHQILKEDMGESIK